MTSHHAITAPKPWWAAGDGGHLDNLAMATNARGQGIGQLLVRTLLQAVDQDEPAMVTLTTSIPGFFWFSGLRPAVRWLHCDDAPSAQLGPF